MSFQIITITKNCGKAIMILVDTSVLIDFFRGRANSKCSLFSRIVKQNILFAIPCFSYQELLQGAKNENEWNLLSEYLSTQIICYPPNDLNFYKNSGKIYFDLRKLGITVRSSIDILIAQLALTNDMYLLHNDKDFDFISYYIKNLKIIGEK